jgi:cation diffusion facilitator CzcD-associated flavoprotein CzcO
VPFFLHASRFAKYWLSELSGPIVFYDSKLLSKIGVFLSKWNLRRQVKDPELRKKLTPDFQFGCKRVLVSDDYWATFERDNVDLVTDAIEEIESRGIRTKDGTLHEADAIVLATGFKLGLVTAPFRVVGRAGRTLDEAWENGAVAYKGMTVAGFPNWFIMMGPNTGPGHTSVLVYTEAQISHALQAIQKLKNEGLKYIDVRQDAQDRYNAGIQKRMKRMVWGGCKSWYLNEDGSNHSLYPGFAVEYVLRSRNLDLSDYEVADF